MGDGKPARAPLDAATLIRVTRSLADIELRVAYWRQLLFASETGEPGELARALDVLCRRAELAEAAAREVLAPLVLALEAPDVGRAVQLLREQAVGEALLALERLLRAPIGLGPVSERAPGSGRSSSALSLAQQEGDPKDARIPDYGRGRTLTLGERKSLARATDRETLARLLRDPHPEVIKRLLTNPKLTEDEVLRLAAKNPCPGDVLAEIARAPRWMQRPRIRRALVLNPSTPHEVVAPLIGLLVRQELLLAARSPQLAPAVRALCLEHLVRRPPIDSPDEDTGALH